jgi:hypothetical protein
MFAFKICTLVLGGVSDLVGLHAAQTSFGFGLIEIFVGLDSGVDGVYILGMQDISETCLGCPERRGEIRLTI